MINVVIIIGLSAAVALLVVRNRYLSVNATMYQELYEDASEHASVLIHRINTADAKVRSLNEQLKNYQPRDKVTGRMVKKVAA